MSACVYMDVCMYTNLCVVKCSPSTHYITYALATDIGGCALWSRVRMNTRSCGNAASTTPVEMHEAHSMHAVVERLFTNTGYK